MTREPFTVHLPDSTLIPLHWWARDIGRDRRHHAACLIEEAAKLVTIFGGLRTFLPRAQPSRQEYPLEMMVSTEALIVLRRLAFANGRDVEDLIRRILTAMVGNGDERKAAPAPAALMPKVVAPALRQSVRAGSSLALEAAIAAARPSSGTITERMMGDPAATRGRG